MKLVQWDLNDLETLSYWRFCVSSCLTYVYLDPKWSFNNNLVRTNKSAIPLHGILSSVCGGCGMCASSVSRNSCPRLFQTSPPHLKLLHQLLSLELACLLDDFTDKGVPGVC